MFLFSFRKKNRKKFKYFFNSNFIFLFLTRNSYKDSEICKEWKCNESSQFCWSLINGKSRSVDVWNVCLWKYTTNVGWMESERIDNCFLRDMRSIPLLICTVVISRTICFSLWHHKLLSWRFINDIIYEWSLISLKKTLFWYL